jgi:hypothetical protein
MILARFADQRIRLHPVFLAVTVVTRDHLRAQPTSRPSAISSIDGERSSSS